jgi:tetratricopeptide (TPR) repeat protein
MQSDFALATIVVATCSLSGLSAQTAAQLHQQSTAAIAANKPQAAISQLEAGVRKFPDDLRLQFDLGLAYVRAGHLESAIRPLRNAKRDPSLAGEVRFLLGAAYFERGEYEKALAEVKGLEHSPHQERILYIVEESSRRSGKLDDAKAAFHELMTTYPDSAWTHYLLGNAYEQQQRPEDAIAEYLLALKKDANIPSARFAIGYIYFRQHDLENAKGWLQQEADSGCHALANLYLGEIAREDRRLAEAERDYRRSLQCDPSNALAHLRLGMTLADTNRYSEALEQLRAAAKLEPNDSSAHYHLASVYSHLGRKQDAEAEYRRVRQIHANKDNGTDVTREPH